MTVTATASWAIKLCLDKSASSLIQLKFVLETMANKLHHYQTGHLSFPDILLQDQTDKIYLLFLALVNF